jgi:hypothetical protein
LQTLMLASMSLTQMYFPLLVLILVLNLRMRNKRKGQAQKWEWHLLITAIKITVKVDAIIAEEISNMTSRTLEILKEKTPIMTG